MIFRSLEGAHCTVITGSTSIFYHTGKQGIFSEENSLLHFGAVRSDVNVQPVLEQLMATKF